MAREILFKAKRIDNGEWVEGTPIFDHRDEQWRIITQLNYSTGTCITSDAAPRVSLKTMCQFTGIYDNKGNKIWENDIVRVGWQDNEAQSEEIQQVSWTKHGFTPWEEEFFCDGCDLFNEIFDIEVIGNIFDNSELLEDDKK